MSVVAMSVQTLWCICLSYVSSAYLMVTPLELKIKTLCLFLGFSASPARPAPSLLPLFSDL